MPLLLLGVSFDEAVWRRPFSFAMALIESHRVPLDAAPTRWLSDKSGRIPRRERADRVRWLLEKVGLSPQHANRYPH